MEVIRLSIKEQFNFLSHYIRPYKYEVLFLTILILVNIALQLILPQIIRVFIDSATAGKEMNFLVGLVIIYILVSVLQHFFEMITSYVGSNIGWSATNDLRKHLVQHCLLLNLDFYKEHTPGQLTERVDSDTTILANFFSNLSILLIGNFLLVVGILFVMYNESPIIGVCFTLFVMLAFYMLLAFKNSAISFWKRTNRLREKFYGFLHETLSTTDDVRANGAKAYIKERFHQMLRIWLPSVLKAEFAGSILFSVSLFIIGLGNLVTFILCAYLLREGNVTMGTVYMIFYYTGLLSGPIHTIRSQLSELQKMSASIIRVKEILHIPLTSDSNPTGKNEVKDGPLPVEFHNVSFSYTNGIPTLKNINFKLNEGKILAVLGKTGSGKSTIARLLLRFIDPQNGEIFIDGESIQTIALTEYRKKVTLVSQEVQLYKASLRDNLTFFDSKILDLKILEILYDIGLDEWYESLPNGLDSVLNSDGEGLSAGQSQLLGIARGFLRNPGLVIFDEPSSRLDPITEHKVERALNKLLVNRTAIIITHRSKTIQRADSLFILEKGEVVEYRDSAELINLRSLNYFN